MIAPVTASDPRTAAIEQLIADFEACAVPRGAWDHRAHLAYALVMLLRHGPVLGAFRIRDGILRFNAALGIEQTPEGGYHETLTRFFIWVVQSFLETSDRSAPLHELLDDLCRRHGSKHLPLRYYSRAHLFSWQARIEWVEPDLAALS